MGTAKTEIFTQEQNALASWTKVMGHPARIAILQHLIKLNACVCGDLVDEIGLAQATISQHLKVLKETGLIKGDISGTSVCYCINQNKWREMKHIVSQFIGQDISKMNC
ncbi:MAG: ArsR family transcriptional regulator [Marivirga sp.]|jgi:ArsR family transcriptional regulator